MSTCQYPDNVTQKTWKMDILIWLFNIRFLCLFFLIFLLKTFLCFGKYFDLWDLSEMMMEGGGSKVLVTSYQVSRNNLFLIDWLSLCCFSPFIWRRYHCRQKAAKYRLRAALVTFKQEEIFIEPYQLWHRTSVFLVSSI